MGGEDLGGWGSEKTQTESERCSFCANRQQRRGAAEKRGPDWQENGIREALRFGFVAKITSFKSFSPSFLLLFSFLIRQGSGSDRLIGRRARLLGAGPTLTRFAERPHLAKSLLESEINRSNTPPHPGPFRQAPSHGAAKADVPLPPSEPRATPFYGYPCRLPPPCPTPPVHPNRPADCEPRLPTAASAQTTANGTIEGRVLNTRTG